MRLTRTANAGVLIETADGKILVDGVCKPCPPYEGTPEGLRRALSASPPDALLFTHHHTDHFDEGYAEEYRKATRRPYFGPAFAFNGRLGNTGITAVPTRHIGKGDVPHVSYVIEGERCLWVLGDASVADIRKKTDLPLPDVLIIPFAYLIGQATLAYTESLGAEKIILLHMPKRAEDPYGLWPSVEATLGEKIKSILIPEIGESILL